MIRGDVVIVPFPFQDKPGEKIRPAVVVQSDAENRLLANTILAMITGNLHDAGQRTTVLVDPRTAEGAGSGLKGASLVKWVAPQSTRWPLWLTGLAVILLAVGLWLWSRRATA